MTNQTPIEIARKDFIENALKYFAWVDSSGIHGKEKYRAYTDFLSKEFSENIRIILTSMEEEMEKGKEKCKRANQKVLPCPECYRIAKDPKTKAISQCQEIISKVKKAL